jgi:acylphosphatase
MRGSYSSDIEGGVHVCLRYAIAGQMRSIEYLEFVAERARWFGVSGWVRAESMSSVTLVAAGPEAMVGALEMACTLGPLTALVEEVEAVAETGAVAAGFEVRQK